MSTTVSKKARTSNIKMISPNYLTPNTFISSLVNQRSELTEEQVQQGFMSQVQLPNNDETLDEEYEDSRIDASKLHTFYQKSFVNNLVPAVVKHNQDVGKDEFLQKLSKDFAQFNTNLDNLRQRYVHFYFKGNGIVSSKEVFEAGKMQLADGSTLSAVEIIN